MTTSIILTHKSIGIKEQSDYININAKFINKTNGNTKVNVYF